VRPGISHLLARGGTRHPSGVVDLDTGPSVVNDRAMRLTIESLESVAAGRTVRAYRARSYTRADGPA
jgi:hypothetical protein